MKKSLIIGSPNSGKSLLFNKLTGLRHKVANFPGITVALGSGPSAFDSNLEFIDFPGIYSLTPISGEERLAVKAFKQALSDDAVESVICLLDATRIEKALFLTLQVIQACHRVGKSVIVAANMSDTLRQHDLSIDTDALSHALGVPVIAISAKTGDGVAQLVSHISQQAPQSLASFVGFNTTELRQLAHTLNQEHGLKGDMLVRTQSALDGFFLHSVSGGIMFFAIMFLLFQSIFTWAAPIMDAVEAGLGGLAEVLLPLLPPGGFQDFVRDALFGGVGAFLVFVPQIFVLTIVIGILEDTGYLARAAVICHKPLRFFGLTGKSFIPMLSGVACAIPGIYAARTIDSPIKRWLTYLAIPLMPCSARLPIYALLIAVFVPQVTLMGGLIGLQGLAMFCLYFFGIFTGLLVTAALSKVRPNVMDDLPFVLEMPPYRVPGWLPILRHSWDRSKHFVTKAGPVIFSVTLVIWVLGYYPNQGADLTTSWLGDLGRGIEPLFEPLGLDWRYGVAIITSFLAREVFVGTLGVLMGIEAADENIIGLAEQIQASNLSLASGIAIIVFFAIALQCISTVAVLKRETGSWRLPAQMFIGYSLLAYGLAFVIYELLILIA